MSRDRSGQPPARASHAIAEVPSGRPPEAERHGLPQPTIWPVTVALGLTLLVAGIPTNGIVAVGGAVLFLLGLWGWVRDLLASSGGAYSAGAGEMPPPEASGATGAPSASASADEERQGREP